LRASASGALVCCSLLALPASSRADDDEKAKCVESSERGQDLRDANSYSLARKAFARCAVDSCPEPLRRDCVQWLVELDDRFPSVVVVARDERGTDLDPVRVLVDGQVLTERLDGALLPVDPGVHVFRYESPGATPVEERVVIQPSEKGRRLNVTLRQEPPHPLVPLLPPPSPSPSMRPWGWALAGVSALSFASEAYFGISGASERSSAFATSGCAPTCPDSKVQSIETKFIVADASLAMGVLSGAASLYFLLLRPEARPPVVALDVIPQSGGVFAGVHGDLP
jgi:hypothetical protein